MFQLLKLAIWIAGIATLTVFGLRHFGYEPNWRYFEEQQRLCVRTVSDCRKTLFLTGIEGALDDCEFDCFNPGSLIRPRSGR